MLGALFSPRGVAVIGASRDETKLGYGAAALDVRLRLAQPEPALLNVALGQSS
jgi:hypothetical protein